MIVSLDELKAVLGIDPTDTSRDDYFTRLIVAKTTWVENFTQRRFDTPIPHEQIERGSGDAYLYLDWKVDDSIVPADPTPNPADSVIVFRRPVCNRSQGWEELTEDDDWERTGQTLTFLQMWNVWPTEDEFMIQYLGGYTAAPEDIKDVIIELASNQYWLDTEAASETSGVTSEKIGDFAYSLGSSSTTTMRGSDAVSDNGMKTLQRYKKRFV